ncbi:MAG: hypothetical protein CVU62_13940 [Deltaproteobacteria bacterium HGW-Deltaproteobacteria-2]|nr:MAG: hypothetical protein CVU62_13940 [Deltaproteobacteria bacterium HGW-Deltaproteobacteria-2]
MKEFFNNLISRDTPISVMRYVFLICVVFIVFTILGVWAYLSVKLKLMQEVPWGLATFAIGLISILVLGKVSQEIWGEKPKDASVIKDSQ